MSDNYSIDSGELSTTVTITREDYVAIAHAFALACNFTFGDEDGVIMPVKIKNRCLETYGSLELNWYRNCTWLHLQVDKKDDNVEYHTADYFLGNETKKNPYALRVQIDPALCEMLRHVYPISSSDCALGWGNELKYKHTVGFFLLQDLWRCASQKMTGIPHSKLSLFGDATHMKIVDGRFAQYSGRSFFGLKNVGTKKARKRRGA
jgi:hypothetical protein